MPGLDLGHLVVVFFIAFLVLGPKRMVEIARSLGKFSRQAQSEWYKFNQSFQEGLKEPVGESAPSPTETTDTPPSADASAEASAAPTSDSPNPEPAPSIAMAAAPVTPAKKSKPKKEPKPQAQSISDHLLDLRSALIRSILAIVILTIIAALFSDTLLYYLSRLSGEEKLRGFGPMDGFLIHLRIALYGGVFLSAPVWIFEVMRFVAPALLPHEKRLIIPGIVAALILFLMGNIFGYWILGYMVSFIRGAYGTTLEYIPQADPFISFVVFFLIATGISFELPIFLLILIRIGWLSPQTLRKQRKISYFIIFVFAELITPVSDPFLMPAIVMLPMIALFEIALFAARWLAPKPKPIAAPPATS